MLLKIYYQNCEDKGELELDVKCSFSEYNIVKKIVDDFKKKNNFYTSAHFFIGELKKFGFASKPVQYDRECF